MEIEKQSGVAPQHQILLFNEKQIKSDSWPVITTREKPLILFHRENNNVTLVDAGEVRLLAQFANKFKQPSYFRFLNFHHSKCL